MVSLKKAVKIVIDPKILIENHILRSALAHLAHAKAYAQITQGSPWEFAVEIKYLIADGLTTSDLRWLVIKNYLEHAIEVTRAGDTVRKFQSSCNLAFSKRSCFVLSEAGAMLADSQSPEPPSLFLDRPVGAKKVLENNVDRVRYVPSWDRDRRVLRVDGCIVKQFRVPSPSQEAILTAFEEEGWPAAIDDPLPPHSEQDSKRRLRNTIQSLNANQKNSLLYFRGDGSGERILWEETPDRAEHLKVKGLGTIRAA